jgi:AraC-like DNA-binding protein
MVTPMVEVLWTARYDYEPGWTLSPHHHSFFQIIYCLGGRGTLTLAGRPYALAPRTLFLIAPAHVHGLVAASAVKTLDIKFRVRDAQLRRALMDLPPVLRRADETAPYLLERIRHEGAARQPFFRELCAASLAELVIALIRHPRDRDRDRSYPADLPDGALANPVALRAVRYLHEHYARPLTLGGMSRVLGVSERHLRACVEEALGSSRSRTSPRGPASRACTISRGCSPVLPACRPARGADRTRTASAATSASIHTSSTTCRRWRPLQANLWPFRTKT